MANDTRSFCKVFWGICLGISLMALLGVGLAAYLTTQEHYLTICVVVDASTATELPDNNHDSNWVNCDCGKRCKTQTPCGRVYVDILDGSSNVLLEYSTISEQSNGNECTFRRGDCDESPASLKNYIIDSQAQIKPYQQKINQTIDCYTNKSEDEAYLKNYVDWEGVYIASGFAIGSLVFLLISTLCCNLCVENKGKVVWNPKVKKLCSKDKDNVEYIV